MMSEGKEEVLETLSEEAAEMQRNGDLLQCVTKLKMLQRHLMQTDRWQLRGSVVWSVCGVIEVEQGKWRVEGGECPSVISLEVVTSALCCLRNTMPNCARNQELVAETEDLLKPITSCIEWTFHTPAATHPPAHHTPGGSTRGGVEGGSVEEGVEWSNAHSTLATACVTCLGNIVAANSKTRKIIWPYFKSVLESVLMFWDKTVAQASTMILHNCLLEAELKEELCKSPAGTETFKNLVELYETETKYSCFVLLCLEVLLATEGFLENTWPSLPENHKCVSLQVIEARLTHPSKPLSGTQGNSILTFLVGVFKTQADCILRSQTDSLNPDSALVLSKLVTFVCGVAACDSWRLTLQQDTSLLVTSVALLQCMHETGKEGGNAFTPLDRFTDLDNEAQMTQAEQHPTFGFKCDLIRIIASLVHRHAHHQNTVRQMQGIPLLLENSKFDARNPLIKEACIFALRNLLEGNLENQQCVEDLRMKGVAENPGLAELGMKVVQEEGKVKVVQCSPSSSPPSGRSCDSPTPEL